MFTIVGKSEKFCIYFKPIKIKALLKSSKINFNLFYSRINLKSFKLYQLLT